MDTFFKENWKPVLTGLIGVILGVFLNNLVRYYKDKQLLTALLAELSALQAKDGTTLSADELRQIQDLKTEIYLHRFKCA